MASILSNNSFQQMPNAQADPATTVNNLVNQIMSSTDPRQAFNQVVNNIDGGANVMNLIQQYGNGDPRAAFMNYAAQQGKNVMAQQIMQRLGLS